MTISDPISGGNFVDNTQYNPGGPGDIVVVRLFYQWPPYVTGLGYNLANLSGSKRLLSADGRLQERALSGPDTIILMIGMRKNGSVCELRM